jgi:Tol biopolymer transport system component
MKRFGCLILFAALALGQDSAVVQWKAAMHKEQVEGDLKGAIEAYRKIIARQGKDRAVVAKAMLQMAQCHEKLGDAEARKIYEQLVKSYGDQTAVAAEARAKLAGARVQGGGQLLTRRENPPRPGCGRVVTGRRLIGCQIEGSLIVVDTATGKEHKITGISQPLPHPGGGSPDGVHFAYKQNNELYVVRLSDKASRKLGEIDTFLTWSPDSKSALVTAGPRGQINLVLIDTDSGTRKTLGGALKNSAGVRAVFSPDGSYAVYQTSEWGTRSDLRIVSVSTGEDTPLVTNNGNAQIVGWHRDGWLLYTSTPAGIRDLFRVKMRGSAMAGAPQPIYRDLDPQAITLGSDGNVHYRLSTAEANVFRATLDASGASFSGAPEVVSKRFENMTRLGIYSRDGKRIAYDTAWRGKAKIIVQDLDTGEERDMPSPFFKTNSMTWYPDGLALLVHGQLRDNAPFGFYRYDLRMGEVRAVLETKGLRPDLATNPTFSADGQSLYFKFWDMPDNYDPTDYTRAQVGRLDLATGRVTELFRPKGPAYLRLFALSPDAKRIVYGYASSSTDRRKDAFAVVDLAGGEPRVIFECEENERSRAYSALSFTADGKGVIFHRTRQRRPTETAPASEVDELWFVPAAGGEPKRLHDTGGLIPTVSARPNSGEIAWQTVKYPQPDFWVMENDGAAAPAGLQ